MTFLIERLADLRKHLDHLESIRGRVEGAESLRRDLSLHNDVLFSLLVVCQSVIDIAGELAARRGRRFQDYTEAVMALEENEGFPEGLVQELRGIPGFRNVLVHEYVELDYDRVLEALGNLDPLRRFVRAVVDLEERADPA